MEALGISGNNLKWIDHWLTNRLQSVWIGSKLSGWTKVISGIPQGSVLGPLLFLLFIWVLGLCPGELHHPEKVSRILKYVDDTKLISKVTKPEDVEDQQLTLNHIYQWGERTIWNLIQRNSSYFDLDQTS